MTEIITLVVFAITVGYLIYARYGKTEIRNKIRIPVIVIDVIAIVYVIASEIIQGEFKLDILDYVSIVILIINLIAILLFKKEKVKKEYIRPIGITMIVVDLILIIVTVIEIIIEMVK